METSQKLTLFHYPHTRSSSVLALLEALGADYQLKIVDLKRGEQREPAYLAINPLGKVPALLRGSTLITEQSAILLYLADLFPERGIAPSHLDPLRGPYLRWIIYYTGCFEPAVMDKWLQRSATAPGMLPYGDWEGTVSFVVSGLKHGPWLLGDQFSAADILWGAALNWMTASGIVESVPTIQRYLDLWRSHPSTVKANAIDKQLSERLA